MTVPLVHRERRKETNDQTRIKMVHSTTCVTPHPPASVDFSSPHQSRPSFSLLLLWDPDREGAAVGFLRPRNSCKPRMALHLFKSCSIMACISNKASCITVHSGVLSGLTLLTSEQMEITKLYGRVLGLKLDLQASCRLKHAA